MNTFDQLVELRRALARAAHEALAQDGLGPAQFSLMRELRLRGPSSQVALARATVQDPAAVVRQLDALEKRGWIARQAMPSDRRQKLIVLTESGLIASHELCRAYDALRARVESALSPADRRAFARLASALIAAMAAQPDSEPTT